MLVAIFLWSGFGKLMGYSATMAYMQKAGVPGSLLPLVIAVELLGGILIAIGWQARQMAFLLAGFTFLAALLFHNDFGDRNQLIHFMKNIAIVGGLLMIVAHGPGAWSIDGRHRQDT